MPFALPFRTIMVGSKSTAELCNVKTSAYDNHSCNASFKIDSSLVKGYPEWANYIKGTIFQYINDLPAGCAFNACIVSDVPIGSGLSSSVSIYLASV